MYKPINHVTKTASKNVYMFSFSYFMNWMREISGRRTLIISDTFVILTDVSCGLRTTKAFEMDISMSDLVCIT